MAGKAIDVLGQKFGRLTVLARSERRRPAAGGSNPAFWVCRCECGETAIVEGKNLRNGVTQSCGCIRKELFIEKLQGRKGASHPAWKGGRFRTPRGYISCQAKGHPRASKLGYVFEHRLVMEKMIGRYLAPNETVHHKNGIKTDNRPENLELWCGSHGSGSRVSDLVQHATSTLRIYAPHLLAALEKAS